MRTSLLQSNSEVQHEPGEARMEQRNLYFEIPLTREQWLQIAESANFRPDYGVMQWEPSEPEVIHLSIRVNDAPEGW